MKGLLKYLSPFAPDQSGAASVFYELGGITVICDAGGCTGNICGFDEPRWFQQKSAIFSAGLRDMDAILGRDDRLVEKLKDTAAKVDASFVAIIGTPVPAVIATDFRALKRMAEKRCGLPVLTVECTGTRMYDEGEEDAYLALFSRFAREKGTVNPKRLGILGATPLNVSCLNPKEILEQYYEKEGYEDIYCYGMGSGLDAVQNAGSAAKNIVLSPSALKTAELLKERFGTPYEAAYPLLPASCLEALRAILDLPEKKVLILHQQVAANQIRRYLRSLGCQDITVASWFLLKKEWREPQDLRLNTEDQYTEYVEANHFDLIIGDELLARPLRTFQGTYLPLTHFAVSGKLI